MLCKAVVDLQSLAEVQSQLNSVFGPLLFVDFVQLVLMTCILGILPLLYSSNEKLGFMGQLIFGGNFIGFFIRLVTLIMCLGSVQPTGIEVNTVVASALVKAQNLNSNQSNSVLALLTVYSSNPIGFTAWEFFPVTRGTLLAALSVISTYAIVIFQANINQN